MTDLFTAPAYKPSYPDAPGFTNAKTSREAAEAIQPSAKSLRGVALRLIAAAGANGLTTNELAEQMGIDRGSVQPRTSELKAENLIVDSGQRRRNDNGKRAIVWTTPEYQDHQEREMKA